MIIKNIKNTIISTLSFCISWLFIYKVYLPSVVNLHNDSMMVIGNIYGLFAVRNLVCFILFLKLFS